MAINLQDLKVAILATDGVEQVELESSRDALRDAGADVHLVSPKNTIHAWKFENWGDTFSVDQRLDTVDADEFDALVLPGGVINPDLLRMNPATVRFIRAFFETGKPVASICHGPWALIEADVVRGRDLTSWPSLKTDLRNAGAHWIDREVVVDGNLVTSRKPNDLPAFNREMITLFAEGRQGGIPRSRARGTEQPGVQL